MYEKIVGNFLSCYGTSLKPISIYRIQLIVIKHKRALLLDMNSTFMFGEDRFDSEQDFSVFYHEMGGKLPGIEINRLIRRVYSFLDERYPQASYRHCFPTVEGCIRELSRQNLSAEEISRLVSTFAHHERGYIPKEYASALHQLSEYFTLSLVIDIWAPKNTWQQTFEESGIAHLFKASSFSSDHGMVKPSAKPFDLVIEVLGVTKKEALVIGDSVRRDLGGAQLAGIDCILVGGAKNQAALACFNNLLDFTEYCTSVEFD